MTHWTALHCLSRLCRWEEVCMIPCPCREEMLYSVSPRWWHCQSSSAVTGLAAYFGVFPSEILPSPLAFSLSHSHYRAMQDTKCPGLLSFSVIFLFLKSINWKVLLVNPNLNSSWFCLESNYKKGSRCLCGSNALQSTVAEPDASCAWS